MRRFKFKYTDKLMYYISHHFTEPHDYNASNSICTWKIQLTNTDNENWCFSGPLGEAIFSYKIELSGLARRTLLMPQLLMFDGNGCDLVLDSTTKNFNIYLDRVFTVDSDLEIGVPILCVEEKSTNNFYFCNSYTTFAYWDYLEHRSVTEPELERMIASQSPY